MRKRLFLFAALIGITLPMMAAIELSKPNPTYEQNFDGTATAEVLAVDETALAAADAGKRSVSLAVDLPEGWKIRNGSSTSAIGVYATGTDATTYVGGTSLPSNAKNGTWNLGKIAATDRAIGGITSSTSGGAQSINILCQITNTEAEAITSLDLSYAIEQYRKGIKDYKMTLYTSTTGANGSWTVVDDAFSLTFDNTVASATGAADASLPISTKSVEDQKLVVTIASSASLYLAWHIAAADGTEAGGAAALALDDVTITANYGEVTPGPEPEPEPATPIASGELFGTYQEKDVILPKEDGTDPQQIGVDFYIATCGQKVMLRAISTGETKFGGAGWETQLRVETGGRREIQACKVVSNKNHYTGAGCNLDNLITTKAEDLTMHFFVNGSYPAGVDGGYRKTTDFAFNRYSINNPIADAVAPVLDVENTTFVDNGDGTITVTFGAVTADDEYFYYVADKDHNLGDISLDKTITLTKPTVEDGTTYTLRAYAVDFNGNKSAAKEYEIVMPFDQNLNIAKGKVTNAGKPNGENGKDAVVDGVLDAKRWSSNGGDHYDSSNPTGPCDDWWQVDLGNAYVLDHLNVWYEGACPKEYDILGSMDGTNWTVIQSYSTAPTTGNAPEKVNVYDFSTLTPSARFVKIFSRKNNTGYGISMYEFEVYASGLAAQDATAPTIVSLSEVSSTINSATLELIAYDKDDNGDDADIQSIKVSDVANGLAEQTVVLDGNNQFTISDLKFNTTYTFHVVVADKAGNQASKDLEVVLPFNTGLNLAENKPSEANATQDANVAKRGNDGSTSNFWTSYGKSLPDGDTYFYWQVDLEELYAISRVNIIFNDVWGTYNILYGADGEEWHTYEGDFKVEHQGDSHEFAKAVTARYFRFTSTDSRVGIKEFEVYGTGFAGADSKAPVVSANEVAASATTNSVKLHIEASDLNDNDEPQPMPIISISGNYGFTTIENAVLDAEGNITLTDLIKNKRAYTFKVTATDLAGNKSEEKSVRVELPFDPDYDMGKNVEDKASAPSQVWAGATETGHAAINAVRETGYWGNYGKLTGTDEEKIAANWWTIDLSVICEISYVNIDFATARKFDLLATFDNKDAVDAGTATWFTVAENLAAADYENTVPNFAARCIRIQSRSSEYMSINRVIVKSTGRATTDAVAPQVTVTEVSKTVNTATLKIVATDEDDAHVAHPVKSITISGDNDFTTIENAVLDGEGNITLDGLKDNTTYHFNVLVTDRVGLTASQENIEVRVAFNTEVNLALAENGATAEAGCAENTHSADKAIDNSEGTYWGTYGCGNWETSNVLTIDLGTSYNIASVVIKTGGMQDGKQDFVLEYQPSAPMSATTRAAGAWIEFGSAAGVAQNSMVTIPVVVTAQTIRLRATQKHFVAIQEFQVFGSSYDDGDDVAPVIESVALVSAGEESAEVSVVATDNVGVFGLQFVDGANDFNVDFDYIHGQNVTLVGLAPGTTYHFSIYALDRAGNVSEPKALEITTANNPNIPHTAAPAPTIAEARVISIFSNTYEPAIKDMKQWAAYGGDVEYSAKVIAGNDYAYYVGHNHGEFIMGYQWEAKDGFTDGVHTGVNVSVRAMIHIDIWALDNGAINVCMNDASIGSATLVGGQWNSIDLPISTANLDILQNLEWIKFTNIQNKTLAIDNIYFYGVGISENADNTSNMETYGGQTVDVVLNRSFAAYTLYTLCLPFDMSAAQVEEAFGTDAEVWKLVSSEDRGSLIHIDFALQSNIEAGVPYLFNPSKDFVSGTAINNVVLKNTTGETVVTSLFTMKGYVNPTAFTMAQEYYFLAADKYLHTLGADVTSPGLRSAFKITEGADPAAARKPARVVLGTEVTTDMPAINAEVGVEKVMRNGQLYIIREGKMYNVQGQLVK